jgi:hypothetical protein
METEKMTKLAFNYDSPENNAAVRIARAKLPSMIGNHLEDKKQRALYREGYAVAEAFGFQVLREQFDNDEARLSLRCPQPDTKPTVVDQFLDSGRWDEKQQIFFSGLVDGAKQVSAEDWGEDDEPEEICNTCYMARELHYYMQFRAAREGVEHKLTEDYYRQALHGGIQSAFGVTFDIDEGVLLADVQNPEALEVWLDTCRCCGKSIKQANAEAERGDEDVDHADHAA